MTDAHDTRGAGDNSADPHALARADIEERIKVFIEGAEVWAKRSADDMNDDLAARANDYLTGARKLFADAQAARKAEKQPHLDAGRAVDEQWAPLIERIEKLGKIVTPLLAAFLQRQEAENKRRAAEAEREAREAAEKARAAELDAQNATSVADKLAAQEQAQASRAAADRAKQDAERATEPTRVESATGLGNRRGLRTVRVPRIVSLPAVFNHYRGEEKVAALMLELAARDLRAAPVVSGKKQIPTIPGIAWDEERKV